jgi:GNAT superfamily N-acetyltransferase
MNFRKFTPSDAEFCFKIRSNAFIQLFYGELTPKEVAAGVNAYMLDDYVKMGKDLPFFIVEEENRQLGFFTLKRLDHYTAKIPFLYIDLDKHGRSIGTTCVDFIEQWLASNWIKVNRLIVDTVIPKYNSGFYKKAGFSPSEEVICDFQGCKVKALRLVKKL